MNLFEYLKIRWKQFRCAHNGGRSMTFNRMRLFEDLIQGRISLDEASNNPPGYGPDTEECLVCGKVWTR
jgi:hypothetical protein